MPNQCEVLGALRVLMGSTACGSYGVIQRQNSAENTHTATIAAPIMNVFECSRPRTSSARRARRRRATSSGDVPPGIPARSLCSTALTSPA